MPSLTKIKKEKKLKQLKVSESDSEDSTVNERSKKKDKKRKVSEIDEEERSSELVEPMKSKAAKGGDSVKKKRMKLAEVEEEENGRHGGEEEDPNDVLNFRISAQLRETLKAKGTESLFKIQAMTLDVVPDGSDLVVRARTGQIKILHQAIRGKTLAFVLPILKSLTNGPTKTTRKTGYGRVPSVLVLLPTRELATGVFADFEVYGRALGLTSSCLYGRAPYQNQPIKLKRGVDIVIGTPGRIKVTLSGFRSGKFMTLVTTNVAARGLDINDVQLIIQACFSKYIDTDSFHNWLILPKLLAQQQKQKQKQKRSPKSDGVIPIFKSADQELLNTSGLAPVELLAKALAKSVRLSLVCIMQGYTEIKSRLLLSSMENYVTVMLESERPIYTLSPVPVILNNGIQNTNFAWIQRMLRNSDLKDSLTMAFSELKVLSNSQPFRSYGLNLHNPNTRSTHLMEEYWNSYPF
ncbi:DEAD box RNA helicase [Actinidia rufa]|uniref:RNA helicase n=1 Tax=Actinidia rufa TaxID=165716 RepID=A0A7J0EA57_9ERIC|nr:DEAD box RNA helicase [Actinidia rufa]